MVNQTDRAQYVFMYRLKCRLTASAVLDIDDLLLLTLKKYCSCLCWFWHSCTEGTPTIITPMCFLAWVRAASACPYLIKFEGNSHKPQRVNRAFASTA